MRKNSRRIIGIMLYGAQRRWWIGEDHELSCSASGLLCSGQASDVVKGSEMRVGVSGFAPKSFAGCLAEITVPYE